MEPREGSAQNRPVLGFWALTQPENRPTLKSFPGERSPVPSALGLADSCELYNAIFKWNFIWKSNIQTWIIGNGCGWKGHPECRTCPRVSPMPGTVWHTINRLSLITRKPNKCRLYRSGRLGYVNLTQLVIWEEGTSPEKTPPSGQAAGKPLEHFCCQWLMGEDPAHCGRCHS